MNERLLLRRYAMWNLIWKQYTFKTLYRTKSEEWTENIDDGDWHSMFPASPTSCKVCDTKYENYFMVGDKRYDSFREAIEPMIEEIIRKAVIMDFVTHPKRYLKLSHE